MFVPNIEVTCIFSLLAVLGLFSESCVGFVVPASVTLKKTTQVPGPKLRRQVQQLLESQNDNHLESSEKPEASEKEPASSDLAAADTAAEYTINNEPVIIPEGPEPIRTIGGGVDMIFEMARQMLLWDETEDSLSTSTNNRNDSRDDPPPTSELLRDYQVGRSDNPETKQTTQPTRRRRRRRVPVLPRWRPLEGVADVNPNFRTQSPMMNSVGYSRTIWRNVRKANKPSLWRHALRTYDRMDQNVATNANGQQMGVATAEKNTKLRVQRSNSHHEGALVACAKLGLWKKAIQIYQKVEEEHENRTPYIKVTDNMVLSVIRACVRGSRDPENTDKSLEERRAPLDACSELLLSMEEKHGLPLVARHLNPLAAAYQKLGLVQEASTLLNMNLEDRTSGPEEENGLDPFNVNDVRAKDKGSYSLLVKGAVSEGKWADAVDALRTMTEAGLYPNSRNLNAWTEVSERKTKQRATRSWKKKRNEYWLESVR